MRKHVWLAAILIIALLAVAFTVGCGKKESSSVATAPGETSKPEVSAGPANNLEDLLEKQKDLSSYVMSMDVGGMKMKMYAKMEAGKPVAMKTDMGSQGWMLMRMDKKMHYMYNPSTKAVMAMPMSDSMMSSMNKNSAASMTEQLKAMAGSKVSSDTVDGVDCLKVVSKQGTFWCDKEHGLPVQMQSGDKTMKFTYDKINAVPDSEFELPAGVKVEPMPAMPTAPKGP